MGVGEGGGEQRNKVFQEAKYILLPSSLQEVLD